MQAETPLETRQIGRVLCRMALAVGIAALAMRVTGARGAEGPPPHDLLNATLWMQRSVEYKANTLAIFALASMRLDQALADRNWTAAPAEQTGAYQDLPPAVIADLDETLLDNSAYQVWMLKSNNTFEPSTWARFVSAQITQATPGAVEFAKYAVSRGVKVFYITNRNADEEAATRQNLERLGFPMGDNVDTLLTTRKRPEWTSVKGTRRAYVARNYRVLLNLGDNFGDFVDDYLGGEAERMKVFEVNRERWGREWIVPANPSYGSFESAPFRHDRKLSIQEQRKAKYDVLQGWPGP